MHDYMVFVSILMYMRAHKYSFRYFVLYEQCASILSLLVCKTLHQLYIQ